MSIGILGKAFLLLCPEVLNFLLLLSFLPPLHLLYHPFCLVLLLLPPLLLSGPWLNSHRRSCPSGSLCRHSRKRRAFRSDCDLESGKDGAASRSDFRFLTEASAMDILYRFLLLLSELHIASVRAAED